MSLCLSLIDKFSERVLLFFKSFLLPFILARKQFGSQLRLNADCCQKSYPILDQAGSPCCSLSCGQQKHFSQVFDWVKLQPAKLLSQQEMGAVKALNLCFT